MITEKDIDEYKQEMLNWIVVNTDKTHAEIREKFESEQERIDSLFKPYPETVMSQDVSKWAELLAISFGFLKEEELEFVD